MNLLLLLLTSVGFGQIATEMQSVPKFVRPGQVSCSQLMPAVVPSCLSHLLRASFLGGKREEMSIERGPDCGGWLESEGQPRPILSKRSLSPSFLKSQSRAAHPGSFGCTREGNSRGLRKDNIESLMVCIVRSPVDAFSSATAMFVVQPNPAEVCDLKCFSSTFSRTNPNGGCPVVVPAQAKGAGGACR